MSDSALDTFTEGIDPDFVPAVLALHRAVMAVRPDFETRISYKMLMYYLAGDIQHWICAVNASKNAAHLRFLYGVLMADPRGLLRAGTGQLRTIDFASLEEIDAELVAEYVTEALSKLDYFKEHGVEPPKTE